VLGRVGDAVTQQERQAAWSGLCARSFESVNAATRKRRAIASSGLALDDPVRVEVRGDGVEAGAVEER
jgi:hypothetical protein